MPASDLFQAFALALALSFFFGLAFEDFYGRVKEARPGGVRTFPLLTLAGAILYLLDSQRFVPLSVGLASVGTWLAIYYYRRTTERNAQSEEAVGLMVPVCNVIAFLLGPAALAEPLWVPAGVTAAAVLFLTSRERLHYFARKIEIPELVTAGKFLVLTGLVLPLLPNYPVTTLTTITPRQAWLALVAVSSISYASYLLQRYVWPRSGTLIVAILGGLYSSTATAVALARQARQQVDRSWEVQVGIVISTAVMYLRVLAVVAVFNFQLAMRLGVPAMVLCIFALLIGAIRYAVWPTAKLAAPAVTPPLDNPLALSTATVFAALFVLISLATTWVRTHFGAGGVYALAGLVGFADVDPFVLNLAEHGAGDISSAMAATAILLATSSNNLLKAVYVFSIAGPRNGLMPAMGLAALAFAGAGAAYWANFTTPN